MTIGDAVCDGEFKVPYVDALTMCCNRCGAEVDADDPVLLRARGRHNMMPTVPRGISLAMCAGTGCRQRDWMVPKYTPMHIYADVQLGWWERICVLIWAAW